MRVVHDTPSLRAFADEVGYPVILKRVDGAASVGMTRVDDAQDLARVGARLTTSTPMLAE